MILPYERFDQPDKRQKTELPPYDAFYTTLLDSNPFQTENTDYVNILKSGLNTEQAFIKLKLSKPPPNGIENHQYLPKVWKQEMSSFKDFLRWYNNKDLLATLEAMQKMIAFYHEKDKDMLKLGCTLPNMANICLHKSTDAKLYPFTGPDKDLLKKIEKMLLVVFLWFLHAKRLLMKVYSEISANISKSVAGIDAARYNHI